MPSEPSPGVDLPPWREFLQAHLDAAHQRTRDLYLRVAAMSLNGKPPTLSQFVQNAGLDPALIGERRLLLEDLRVRRT
jgi:hypothetical protein